MKTLKISLVTIVLLLICFFLFKWFINTEPPKKPKPPINEFTEKIEKQIIGISNIPLNEFNNDDFVEVEATIYEFYKNNELGANESDNKEWKEIFSKDLYTAYVEKFIEQANFIFNGSEWKKDKLDFLRKEIKFLKASPYLDSKGPESKTLNTYTSNLSKFDEINSFIANCNGFYFANLDINASYPEVSGKIQKSKAYLSNKMDNKYVNKCTRLTLSVREIPKKLFDKHSNYLVNKIQNNGVKYSECSSVNDFKEKYYDPLKKDIDDFNGTIYGVGETTMDDVKEKLKKQLDKYYEDAYNYPY